MFSCIFMIFQRITSTYYAHAFMSMLRLHITSMSYVMLRLCITTIYYVNVLRYMYYSYVLLLRIMMA